MSPNLFKAFTTLKRSHFIALIYAYSFIFLIIFSSNVKSTIACLLLGISFALLKFGLILTQPELTHVSNALNKLDDGKPLIPEKLIGASFVSTALAAILALFLANTSSVNLAPLKDLFPILSSHLPQISELNPLRVDLVAWFYITGMFSFIVFTMISQIYLSVYLSRAGAKFPKISRHETLFLFAIYALSFHCVFIGKEIDPFSESGLFGWPIHFSNWPFFIYFCAINALNIFGLFLFIEPFRKTAAQP